MINDTLVIGMVGGDGMGRHNRSGSENTGFLLQDKAKQRNIDLRLLTA